MINGIKWDNHPILINLELNFLKSDGTPYNTIILAGENGVGKTAILETLNTFITGGSFAPFEYIKYRIGDDTYEINKHGVANPQLGHHHRSKNNGAIKLINNANISTDVEDIRHYRVAYSRAHSGFVTDTVQTTTTKQLDVEKSSISKGNYTLIKQLLIDIGTEDSRDLEAIIEDDNSKERIDEHKRKARMSRFKNAFNNFFSTIKLSRVCTIGNELQVTFSKGTNTVSIDQLSTGEKQIVFRGADLLRNKNILNGGTVLIDEPELSMHPKWQEKILEYYRGLFTPIDIHSPQMFIATHSEYVLKAALEDKENVLVIVLQDEGNEINARKMTTPFVLPTITSAELNYVAFKVASIDYHIELYGYLQNKTGRTKVKDCDDYIAAESAKVAKFNMPEYKKSDTYNSVTYSTLSTYIRNAIDHPDSGRYYDQDQLKLSIELLIELCKTAVPHP